MPDRTPDSMSDRMPEDMPDKMPEDMPDRMSSDMPDRMPQGMPDKVSECLPDRMPEDLPDRMPDRMSEDMPEDMPEHMPEDIPGRMPEDMPDRMPEDMSDRMPEDLPVTKGINVMVGITRSKVILVFRSSWPTGPRNKPWTPYFGVNLFRANGMKNKDFLGGYPLFRISWYYDILSLCPIYPRFIESTDLSTISLCIWMSLTSNPTLYLRRFQPV